MPSSSLKHNTRYYFHRFWSYLQEMSGATPAPHEPESFVRPPGDFGDGFGGGGGGGGIGGVGGGGGGRDGGGGGLSLGGHGVQGTGKGEEFVGGRDRGMLRHGMSAISIERLHDGLPPPPHQTFGNHGTTGYNYQNPNSAVNKFSKRKQSITAAALVDDTSFCAIALTLISVLIIIFSMPFSLFFCIKVVQEYERAVIFRLGRLVTGGARGPGIFFIIPCIDTYSKADLRTVSFDVPPQEILSRDSVTVAVDAVVYFRISNAIASVSNVEDYARSTRLLAATTLRNVLGTKNLSEILSERESISHMIQSALDDATDTWGVKVERVEIKDVRLPVQLQRAMAAEAEATREARAKVIAAEGEQRASRALRDAAEVISQSPAALQLRYLHTLNSIAAEKNSTIIFPVPIEMFKGMSGSDHSRHHHHSVGSPNGSHVEHGEHHEHFAGLDEHIRKERLGSM